MSAPCTPGEYEELLIAGLDTGPLPLPLPQCWQRIYQDAEKRGIQPSTQRFLRKVATLLPSFNTEDLATFLQMLREHAVSLDAVDEKGRTPLMHAFDRMLWRSSERFDANIQLWLDAGERMTITDHAGNTFLHLTGEHVLKKFDVPNVIFAYSDSILFLLKRGGNVLARNHEGLAAHEVVRKNLVFDYPELASQSVHDKITHLEQALDEAALQCALGSGAHSRTGKRRRV